MTGILDSSDCIQRLIDAGGGMKTIEGWFSQRTFNPDRLARIAVEDYGNELFECLVILRKEGATEDQQERWAAGYVKRWLAYQIAGSRTMNWMITGPARFPVERNEKRMATERKRYDELSGYAQTPNLWLNRQKRRAERAELSESAKGQLFKEECICGVRVVHNTTLERIQLIFPGRPDDETRADLKSSAFRWSPREGAWQRKLTRNGVWAANGILAALAEREAAA